ncbi:MAG: hypothetical protein KDD55_08905 [Bdellovibrionales bacterium]|nr:hypothetical protein [Bdellovibrionales bacterium]
MKLPLSLVNSELGFKLLSKIPSYSIPCDWFGNEAQTKASFQLAASCDHILFAATVSSAPLCNTTLSEGEYVEGLWKQDVAELFLCEERSTAYQEFNLAPTGAWWSFAFSDYRKEDEARYHHPEGIQCLSEIHGNSWSAAILIPRDELSITFDMTEHSRANVCFILGNEEQKQFFSWKKLGEEEPDYHLVQNAVHLSPAPLKT